MDGPRGESKVRLAHPHNISLELWTDLGGIGALLFATAVFAMGLVTRQHDQHTLPVISAIGAAAFLHSMTGASYVQGWWIASLVFATCVLEIPVGQRDDDDKESPSP